MDDSGRRPTSGIIYYSTGVVKDIPPDKELLLVQKKERIAGTSKVAPANGQFVKVLDTAWAVMANIALSKAEQKVLWALVQLVQYGSHECRHKNNHHITAKWLTEQSGISQSTVSRALAVLESHGFILRQDKAILINPYFAVRGKYVRVEVAHFFRDTEFYKLANV